MDKPLLKRILHLDFVPRHRMESRSFVIRGNKFPICARCTAILLGYAAVPFLFGFGIAAPLWLGIILNLPMITDGYTQLKKWRTSNNTLRFLTGLVAGVGQAILVATSSLHMTDILLRIS